MTAYTGDCRDVMRDLIAQGVTVQTCVTSPPYWGLRDYGCPPVVWGGDPACAHEWGEGLRRHKGGPHGDTVALQGRAALDAKTACKDIDAGKFCQQCGAWCGQLGLEPTIDLYIEHMLEVFRLVRELLKDDGTLWLNIGDSYATGAGKVGECPGGGDQGKKWSGPVTQPNRMPQPGLKPKDLCMVPARLALALQADGWWVRQDIIWNKPNPMPESVTDRCTKAHEYLFLLTKSERYFFDAAAISEPAASADGIRWDNGKDGHGGGVSHAGQGSSTRKFKVPAGWDTAPGHHEESSHRNGREAETSYRPGQENVRRNKRSVWTIPTQPYPEAHFATFPPALIEPCILAGSRPGDIVFDPFLGSGTTGMVAENLGRQWIGIDIHQEYAALQKRRIQQRGLPL